MRTQTTSLINRLSKETVKNLTKEVKETLAFGFNANASKIFSATELWNIQRQRRSINIRRGF